MKIAILLCGNIRTWDQCRESFSKTFYEFSPDIFVQTYDLRYNYHPFIKQKINYMSDEKIDKDFVIFSNTNLKVISKRIEEYDAINIREKYLIGSFDEKMKDIYHGYYQYKNLYECNEQLLDHQQSYDIIVKTRFDVVYNSSSIKKSIEDAMLLKNNTFFFEGNFDDKFFIYRHIEGSENYIKKITSFILKEYFHCTSELSYSNPPHGLLEYSLKSLDIEIRENNSNWINIIRKS